MSKIRRITAGAMAAIMAIGVMMTPAAASTSGSKVINGVTCNYSVSATSKMCYATASIGEDPSVYNLYVKITGTFTCVKSNSTTVAIITSSDDSLTTTSTVESSSGGAGLQHAAENGYTCKSVIANYTFRIKGVTDTSIKNIADSI